MKKPNFFVVGEPKSGTTALYEFLKQHPDIFLSKQKELHHFSKDLNEERKKFHGKSHGYFNYELKDYLKHFSEAGSEKAIGDVTPQYLFSKVAAKEIHNFNKNAKIIALFREPVDYLHSEHSQVLYSCNETEEDFKRALELESSRKSGRNIPPNVREPSQLFYSEKVKYAEQLNRYLEVFPREQIFIIIFDEFKADNEGVYKKVLEFLGVNAEMKPVFKKYNVNTITRFRWLRLGHIHLAGSASGQILKSLIPKSLGRCIKKAVYWLNTKETSREPLDPEFKQRLMVKYKQEVVKLNTLLHEYAFCDKDLVKLWGYDKL